MTIQGQEFEQPFHTTNASIAAHLWYIAIGAPLSGDDPCGEACDELNEFQDIESELMKRGTLAHGQIRWQWLAEQAALLLQSRTKDFRLLGALLQAVPYTILDAKLPFAAALSARFLTLWGKHALPRGRAGAPHILRIVDILEVLAAKAGEDLISLDDIATSKAALSACSNVLAQLAPDLGVRLAVLPSKLDANVTDLHPEVDNFALTADQPQVSLAMPAAPVGRLHDQPAPRPDSLRLDAGNERALKQSLSVVADFLLGLDVSNPLSYRLRRFATWYGITALPPIKTGTRTVLQAVAEDVVENYRAAAERGIGSHEMVQKLERSCHLQPFWLEGQMLSHRLARACGRDAAARAIKEDAANFLSSVAGVSGLGFSNGAPILTGEVAAWLGSVDINLQALQDGQRLPQLLDDKSPSFEYDMQRIAQEARSLAEDGDLPAALKMLDSAQVVKRDARGITMWELITLECLGDWGMKSHVSAQASRLKNFVANLSVQEWEPEVINRIGRLTKDIAGRR